MAFSVQPSTIKAIANSIDIPKLSDEAAKAMAPDVEYRLREVIQVNDTVVAPPLRHSLI